MKNDAVASSGAVVALELQFGADKVADRRNAPTVGCLSRVDHVKASVSGPTLLSFATGLDVLRSSSLG